MEILKVIISSKTNLKIKYGSKFKTVEKMLSDLVKADKKRGIKTQIIYIDDPMSVKKAGIKSVKSVTRQSAKKAVDEIDKKMNPAYMVLFGAQDIFPFQEINNPTNDDDDTIPSDLPYACDAPYSNNISSFTGPSRVVGRIPDIPAIPDVEYLKIIFDTIIKYKKTKSENLMDYFAITANVWEKSTQQSLSNMFGNTLKLKGSPPSSSKYTVEDLKPLTHFYNCHGSPIDSHFYGQKGNDYPTAQFSADIDGKITPGTVIAAECCYGAEIFDPTNEDTHQLSIASTYLKNKAIAFLGSSTIAYGPSSGNELADLITQYFIKNIIKGSSTGRALLEARQKFLTQNGPYLDPYELKTLAQFHLLGDPSIHPTFEDVTESKSDTLDNRRLNLHNKGLSLAATLAPAERMKHPISKVQKPATSELKKIFKQTGFTGKETEVQYEVKSKNKKIEAFAKGMSGKGNVIYRAFIQKPNVVKKNFSVFEVLVVKEKGKELLGWKLYYRK